MPRTCTICRHPERHDIEANLKAGLPYRDVARRHSVSEHALWRHRSSHVSRHSATVTTTLKVTALLDEAWTAPNWNVSLLKIREARHYVEKLMAMLARPL
jgi:hypothetical protein